MSAPTARTFRRRRIVFGAGSLVSLLAGLTLVVVLAAPRATAIASGTVTGGNDQYFTDDSVPASEVTMFGASPLEAPDETWGIGLAGENTQNYVIVRFVAGEGWTRAKAILDSAGEPLTGFVPAETALEGQTTPDGSGVLAGTVEKAQVLLVRNPGQAFAETSPELVPEEGEESLLREGETLFASGAPLLTAVEEGSDAGALVVPGGEVKHAEPAVLHWEGQSRRWTREPVELPSGATSAEFQPVAIAASSLKNAWLLARDSKSEGVALFRRHAGSKGSPASWVPASPGTGEAAGAPLTVADEHGTVQTLTDEPEAVGQPLTVTEQGVWVDGELSSKKATVFFEATGEEPEQGVLKKSWCNVKIEAEASSEDLCSERLPEPEELPSGEYRSFAWPGSGFGERVITGFPDDAILRLEGDEFVSEATLGEPGEPYNSGAAKGAAFSSAFEGWLGDVELPVHASLEKPADELEYWPTPFHKPLLAIAGQPAVAVGGGESEALAVGQDGEVARYIPEQKNWQPESLFEASGRRAEPQLHGVAWPTPGRAYAVGARGEAFGVVGEMWLWRKETGLWEPDPAAPANLRANLLGIAFESGEPSRGYVVGQQGALMRYGKTWTQEPTCQEGVGEPCLPPELADASFTGVAFAGAEALVAYRVPHVSDGAISYSGGVLANNGSGWRIDTEMAAALPTDYVPWAVAGLPDGGAAVSASVPGGNQEPRVVERNQATSAWETTPEPYPGYSAPAWLSLFRENGALRAVGSGAIPNTIQADEQTPPPAGFPPVLAEAYPLGLSGGVIRQTASGWSDEEHEQQILRAPLGGYDRWDIPYEPDPTSAILLNESGTAGWAVGGALGSSEGADTADIARYPADPGEPSPKEASAIPLAPKYEPPSANEPEVPSRPPAGAVFGKENPPGPKEDEPANPHTAFAVGGGSQCAAICGEDAHARIGPDRWLENALTAASKDSEVHDFLYTGPRVTNGAAVHATTIPYNLEFKGYAEVLAHNPKPTRTRIAASGTDHEHGGSVCSFDESGVSSYLGEVEMSEPACGAYYAYTEVESAPPPGVEVIVLDDGEEIGSVQRAWLENELAHARAASRPALVIGNGNLKEQAEKGKGEAAEVVKALVQGHAAAYLFDAPEQNVQMRLDWEGKEIPAYGSGTLGYINAETAEHPEFIGASGFLQVEVGEYNKAHEKGEAVTQVIVRLIPDIEELALDAHKGTVLHRSEAALFSALARRPRAGGVGEGSSNENESASFVPIPANCQGTDCAEGILPEYRFTSESDEKGRFVKENEQAGTNAEVPELVKEEPYPEPESALFCAYNPGKTKVTVEAGGLAASLEVEIEAGSVRRPCGTVPAHEAPLKTQEQAVASPPPPPATESPVSSTTPAPLVPVPPVPAAVTPPAPRPPSPPTPPPLLLPTVTAPLVAAIVPPPLPPVGEPTPPSGTSAVTSPVEAAQREEEEEEATESVSAQAVSYDQSEHEPSPAYLLGLMVLAAFAGATIRKRSRRGEREVRVASATISSMRAQRRMGTRRRERW